MLPEAPPSDYFLLTLIVGVTGVVPYVVALVAPRALRRHRGENAARSVPTWALWVVPVLLIVWWFAAAWLFLADH